MKENPTNKICNRCVNYDEYECMHPKSITSEEFDPVYGKWYIIRKDIIDFREEVCKGDFFEYKLTFWYKIKFILGIVEDDGRDFNNL